MATSIEIRVAWGKGDEIGGYDPYEYRADDFGNGMQFSEYGEEASPLGWAIYHGKPMNFRSVRQNTAWFAD